jgi:hypothetical protein
MLLARSFVRVVLLAFVALLAPVGVLSAAAAPPTSSIGHLLPMTALAAPAITITPATLPRGGTATVTGTGFPPNAHLELFVVLSYFNNARVKLANITVGADGSFTTTAGPNGATRPGPFPLVVASDGVDLAQGTITVTDASIATERLTITPSTGPVGSRFTATGEGYKAGSTVTAFTTESAKGPRGNFRQVATAQVPADGRVSFGFATPGYSAESYDVIVYGPGGPQIGLPLVVTSFTLTAPAVTGGGTAQVPAQMPSTGGGAGASDGLALLGLLLAGLGGAGLIAQRRRQ